MDRIHGGDIDMKSEELREKVAKAIGRTMNLPRHTGGPESMYAPEADAAIRVVLEAVLEEEGAQNYILSSYIRSLLPQDKQEDAA